MTRGEKCEHRNCTSHNTETEMVHGHALTLCENHGPWNSRYLTDCDYADFYEWKNISLKPKSARRWQKRGNMRQRKREVIP